ncbi:MAG: hypothetical protein AB8B66_06120 [Rickettsiaceae bacterium]
MNKEKRNDFNLNEEEIEILKAFEKGDLTALSTEGLEQEKADAKEAATNYFKKNKKINIRMTEFDLNQIKRIAAREGLPYQTLISSVLHKYATGIL